MPRNRPKLVILACPKMVQIPDFGIRGPAQNFVQADTLLQVLCEKNKSTRGDDQHEVELRSAKLSSEAVRSLASCPRHLTLVCLRVWFPQHPQCPSISDRCVTSLLTMQLSLTRCMWIYRHQPLLEHQHASFISPFKYSVCEAASSPPALSARTAGLPPSSITATSHNVRRLQVSTRI